MYILNNLINIFLAASVLNVSPMMQSPALEQREISDYLKTSHELLYQCVQGSLEECPVFHIVMGNESADTDSISSSIGLAYFLEKKYGNEKDVYLPFMNLMREDLELRQDTVYLLEGLNISSSDLVFLDDAKIVDQLIKTGKVRLNLVDHNILNPQQVQWSPAVEGIFDHHFDEKVEYPLLDSQNKIIETVGSAATLVSGSILKNNQGLMSPELATLLIAPILLDTSNLQDPEKTTPKDIEIASQLQAITGIDGNQFYKILLKKRSDTEGFTPLMLLKKDFKEYQEGNLSYGISSLPKGTIWNFEMEDQLISSFEKFAAAKNLQVLMILVPEENRDSQKGLIVYARDPGLFEELLSHFTSQSELNKHVKLHRLSDAHSVAYFLLDPTLSRKTFQPLLKFSSNSEIQKFSSNDLLENVTFVKPAHLFPMFVRR